VGSRIDEEETYYLRLRRGKHRVGRGEKAKIRNLGERGEIALRPLKRKQQSA